MKIIKLVAENIKRLKAVEIIPQKNIIEITGKNGAGKSSVLDAIWFALGGEKNIQGKPIREGEKKASVTLDLGELIVRRNFTEKGTTLKVEDKEGMRPKSPQGILNELFNSVAFDPLSFLRAPGAHQVETLISLMGLKQDPREIDVEIARKFEQRRVCGQRKNELKAVWSSMPAMEKTAPIVVSDLLEKLSAAIQHNGMIAAKNNYLEKVTADRVRAERELSEIIEREVKVISELKEMAPINAESLHLELKAAEETNKMAAAYDKYQDICANHDQATRDYVALDKEIEALRKKREALIKSGKLPIEELSIGEAGLLYKGIPFEQSSQAEKLRVSVAIAMALNPKLRVIRIADGSLLDTDNMEIIEDLANENDFQVFIERVDETGTAGIFIEDGEIKAPVLLNEKT